MTFRDWVKLQVERQPYWFHRIELPGGLTTPGWSDPKVEKLPHYGLPDDMTGMRVLDVGHAEGFFCFEAERRGASEVIGVDTDPRMIVNFNICRSALNSSVKSVGVNVYDISPKRIGTFDLVLFFGVLYHLRNPLLALERLSAVCTGTLLMQSAVYEDTSDTPLARFHPFGIASGPKEKPIHDPTCFWFPNPACCIAMLQHVGFQQVERISSTAPVGAVFRALAPVQAKGSPPDGMKAPWS